LRALIADGTSVDGAQLPNEARLGERLGVSRITMRYALLNLEEWGLLRREQGRGAFVSSSTVIAGVRGSTSFTQEMADRGLPAASRLLELKATQADNAIASALEIQEGVAVYKIRRLRFGGGSQSASRPLVCLQSACRACSRSANCRLRGTPRCATASASFRNRRSKSVASAPLLGWTPKSSRSPSEARPSSSGASPQTRGPYEFTVSTMGGDPYEIRSKLRA
jgi:GntR family transcriptional regulator